MSDRIDGRRIERNTVEARQGVTGHNVRYVLVLSTAAIALLFALLWLWLVR